MFFRRDREHDVGDVSSGDGVRLVKRAVVELGFNGISHPSELTWGMFIEALEMLGEKNAREYSRGKI